MGVLGTNKIYRHEKKTMTLLLGGVGLALLKYAKYLLKIIDMCFITISCKANRQLPPGVAPLNIYLYCALIYQQLLC